MLRTPIIGTDRQRRPTMIEEERHSAPEATGMLSGLMLEVSCTKRINQMFLTCYRILCSTMQGMSGYDRFIGYI